jgi:hypothetical protein
VRADYLRLTNSSVSCSYYTIFFAGWGIFRGSLKYILTSFLAKVNKTIAYKIKMKIIAMSPKNRRIAAGA